MSKIEIRKEALKRQGTRIHCDGTTYLVHGSGSRAEFEAGSEGLVHLVTNESTGIKFRIKCFWEPTENRRKRSVLLAKQQLADLETIFADALGGAPFDVLGQLDFYTPFAVVMKNVNGRSWKNFKEQGEIDDQYPPKDWPDLKIRATWAYGLAVAVRDMEKREFIHADLSPGNVMVTPDGPYSGDMALVDFDGFVHPDYRYLDTTIKGSEGYAAPEVFNSQSAEIGSDRIGMAILVQEFLLMGSEGDLIDPDDVFDWGYEQEEINNRKVEAHPFIKQRFPPIAQLVEETIKAEGFLRRPEPEEWLPHLRSISKYGDLFSKRLSGLKLLADPPKPGFNLSIPNHQLQKNLLNTPFKIRATIERDSQGIVSIVVHQGGKLRVKMNKKSYWQLIEGGDRVDVEPGMRLFDTEGVSSAILKGEIK